MKRVWHSQRNRSSVRFLTVHSDFCVHQSRHTRIEADRRQVRVFHPILLNVSNEESGAESRQVTSRMSRRVCSTSTIETSTSSDCDLGTRGSAFGLSKSLHISIYPLFIAQFSPIPRCNILRFGPESQIVRSGVFFIASSVFLQWIATDPHTACKPSPERLHRRNQLLLNRPSSHPVKFIRASGGRQQT